MKRKHNLYKYNKISKKYMFIKKIINGLEKSIDFKNWHKDNDSYYLVHIFFMSDQPLQLGYYHEKNDEIVTIDILDDLTDLDSTNIPDFSFKQVRINPPSSVFKEHKKVKMLDLNKVKKDKSEIIDFIRQFTVENYATEKLSKEMIILQNFNDINMYNVTYFTQSFKTLNIKLDAETGNLISHEISSLVSF